MDKETLIFAIGASLIGTAIGALTGLGLSVTAFSPLAIGGIVGSIIPAAATIFLQDVCYINFTTKILLKKLIKSFPLCPVL
ncbi:hypothetical protein [Wolbachia endosymbiont (group A) of Colletes cunicularius]|uniref:hypothetical protein n=1 Tax=Wolbachia endosymbiont (group A) of Colletes cunicularius TaxID=3139321 RepID=UPI0035C8C0F4